MGSLHEDVEKFEDDAVGATHDDYVSPENHSAYAMDDLKKSQTITAIDVENRGAVKGDDSDGRIDWTFKQILATLSLSGLYVGMTSGVQAVNSGALLTSESPL